MGRMKKKFESGEANIYLSRKQALQKLQLSLKMFRRLCILKGIYPREPKNRKRAQKGSTEKKTLYLKKDIQFLLHEPIMWNLRDHKVYMRRKGRARAMRDYEGLKRIMEHKPTYRLDRIVKERYPTFIDAIRDLDDCLTLSCLFSTFPSMRFVPAGVSRLCRRLTTEFMHFVIESRALRKVFVSIKGYYYQVDVQGQLVTWIVPHNFGFQPQSSDEVDFRIMATFVEFYCTVLGFVNFRLFHTLNMCYPPKLITLSSEEGNKFKEVASEDELLSERVAALNQSLLRSNDGDNAEAVPEMDEFESSDTVDAEKLEELKREASRINHVKTLFEGHKFFLNREVPRESLTFVIRAAGGQVSWDKDLFAGATFPESEESITHQIVDRSMDDSHTKYLSRYYIQPQWVFDSINFGKALPVENYFIGAILPPHVSPFLTEREGDYIPAEKRQFFDMENGLISQTQPFNPPKGKDVDEDESTDGEDENVEEEEDSEDEEEDTPESRLKKEMLVEPGVPEVLDPIKLKADETKEEYTLRVMMIRNKHKRVYKRMMEARKRWRKEADKLTTKRKNLESEEKLEKKRKSKGEGETEKKKEAKVEGKAEKKTAKVEGNTGKKKKGGNKLTTKRKSLESEEKLEKKKKAKVEGRAEKEKKVKVEGKAEKEKKVKVEGKTGKKEKKADKLTTQRKNLKSEEKLEKKKANVEGKAEKKRKAKVDGKTEKKKKTNAEGKTGNKKKAKVEGKTGNKK